MPDLGKPRRPGDHLVHQLEEMAFEKRAAPPEFQARSIFLITGARASGKSYIASHLARDIAGAVILEENAYRDLGATAVHDRHQHVFPAFAPRTGGGLGLTPMAEERLRGARVVIIVARTEAREKAALVQGVVPAAVMHLRAAASMEAA